VGRARERRDVADRADLVVGPHDAGERDVAAVAEGLGEPLRRGCRARTSTDSVVPNRAGYRIAGFASMDHVKAIPNYHLMTDVPENVDYGTVADAAEVSYAVAEALAAA
jgi:hypothetical protein